MPGYKQAQIVASSGFDPQKCQVMGAAKAPLNLVGTGSFLPATLTETYATADIIAYNGVRRVKVGREFLFRLVHRHVNGRRLAPWANWCFYCAGHTIRG